MYKLLLTNRASKELDRLRGGMWERAREALLQLAEEPRPPGSKKLRGGFEAYRIRIGDYRAIYDIDDDKRTVTVLRVKHRRDVYRGL